ncbi:hypothetical protein D3C71_1435510 [compost metagenome]
MRTDIDLVHAAAHRRHRAGQAFLHALEGREQLADLVGVIGFHAGGEIPAGDTVEVVASILQRLQHAAAQEDIGGKDQQRSDHAAGADGHQYELVTHLRDFVGVQHLAGAPEVKAFDGAREAAFQRILHLLDMRLVARHVRLFQGRHQRAQALLRERRIGVFDFLQRFRRLGGPGQGLVVVELGLALVHRGLGPIQQAGGLAGQPLREQGGLAHAADDVRIVGRRRAAQAVQGVLVAQDNAIDRVIQFLRLLYFGQRPIADSQRQHAKRRSDHQHE